MKTMNFIKILILILMSLVVACSNPKKKNNVDESIQDLLDSPNIEHSEEIGKLQDSGYLKIVGDSVEIPWFEIELKLSEKAEEKLKADNESIIVAAYFEGSVNENIPEKYKEGVEFGRLHLLTYQIELTDKRLAQFENVKFSKDLYDLLENKDIDLLINVFSGRKSTEFNILRCDILADSMSNVIGKRFTINGKLIYNDD